MCVNLGVIQDLPPCDETAMNSSNSIQPADKTLAPRLVDAMDQGNVVLTSQSVTARPSAYAFVDTHMAPVNPCHQVCNSSNIMMLFYSNDDLLTRQRTIIPHFIL